MISLTYIVAIDLCVLCVSVVPSTLSPARLYLRIHFTHQIQKNPISLSLSIVYQSSLTSIS
ncbi:hypothetical protein [Microcystis aeruginosa]|uniref:hypothetical protein n=1 Tax=Microcystis aeruginosa TaxID=1126 RepID=UPI00292DADCC|nr:hypothetical protein [Microcystis aeruginosa]WOB68304.1 hypothetical protein PJW00_22770 [Microcystis aeruginosa LE3]